MKRRLQFCLRTVLWLRRNRIISYESKKQSCQKLGFCSKIKMHSTIQKNPDITVPSDLLFGESKERFIQRLEELSKLYKPPLSTKSSSLAGILVPFCMVDEKPSILLTKRSHRLVRNKGDVSFPGGKMDDGDEDVIDTALRETEEEIGLSRSNIEIWTTSKTIITTDRVLKVIPVIGFIKNLDMSSLLIDYDEVISVFTIPIEDFCDPDNQAYTKFRDHFIMPLFFKDTYKIWGFTAIIIDFLLATLLPNKYILIGSGYQKIERKP